MLSMHGFSSQPQLALDYRQMATLKERTAKNSGALAKGALPWFCKGLKKNQGEHGF